MNTTIQKQYDELSLRVHRAIEWLDSPEGTGNEINEWLPKYIALFDEWKKVERMMEKDD